MSAMEAIREVDMRERMRALVTGALAKPEAIISQSRGQ